MRRLTSLARLCRWPSTAARRDRTPRLRVDSLEDRTVPTARPYLVADINTFSEPRSSYPAEFVGEGGLTFFSAFDDNHGRELWKSDGTAAGTAIVKDIRPGDPYMDGSSYPSSLVMVNGTLYFAAVDSEHGRELWKSDGTEEGTVLVKDINPGPYSAMPDPVMGFTSFAVVNGTIYFVANDGTSGYELWKSDGTEAGTTMLRDIVPDGFSSYPANLTAAGNTLYFTAYDPDLGNELWKTDGTPEGTTLVADIAPVGFSSYPYQLTTVGNTLYFAANDGLVGTELWKTDGTPEGTTMVADIAPSGSYPNFLTDVDGTLFFSAYDEINGTALWKSDGTEVGTVMVKAVAPDSYSIRSVAGGQLFFSAYDGIGGPALWKSDGTEEGTVMVKSFNGLSWFPSAVLDGEVYFGADDGVHGMELWKSDGSEAGTVMVRDMAAGDASGYPGELAAVNGRLLFAADDGINGREPWMSDGTETGTVMMADVAIMTWSSYPRALMDAGGTLLFAADPTGAFQWELWKTDGTAAGTTSVAAVEPSIYIPPVTVGGTLYFVGYDADHGSELWKSDGSAAGTLRITDLESGPGDRNITDLTVVGGTVYFGAYDDAGVRRLWKTDGSSSGTEVVTDLVTDPHALTDLNGALTFMAIQESSGNEALFRTDGTSAGTEVLAEINASYFDYTDPVEVDGDLYFPAIDPVSPSGWGLWKSDGTAAGTVQVKNLGENVDAPFMLSPVDGGLMFFVFDYTNGPTLWKSDGTETGTVSVKQIADGPYGYANVIPSMAVLDGILYFVALEETHGSELWKSDGTESGTVVVKDIYQGMYGSDPRNLVALGGALYFSANLETPGGGYTRQLWTTDGTEEGTVTVTTPMDALDLGSMDPEVFKAVAIGNRLYFNAQERAHGNELWALDVVGNAPPTVTADSADVVGAEAVEATNTGVFGDPDAGDTVTITADYGTIATQGNVWTWTHTPTDDEAPRTVTVTATDAAGLTATTSFNFSALNRNPTAVDDPVSVVEDGAVDFNVLANDSDPAGAVDPLSVLNHTLPANGNLSVNGDGSFHYVPNPNYHGPDSFQYTVSDGDGGTATATVNITVGSVNDAPVLDTTGTPMLRPTTKLSKAPAVDTPVGDLLGGVSDTDVGAFGGMAIFGADETNGQWEFNLNVTGGGQWNPFPSVAPATALLLADDGNTRIRFVPNSRFQGFASLTFAAWDRTGTAVEGETRDVASSDAFSAASDRAWIAVGATKPVVDETGATVLKALKEDGKPSKPVLVKDMIGIAGLESQFASPGIAVTDTGTDGIWEYQLAKTKEWKLIAPASMAAARLLGPLDKIRFTPAPNADGGGTLTFYAWDTTGGSPGGTQAVTGASFGKDPGRAEVDITPINDAPVMDLSKAAVLNPVTGPGLSNAVTFGSLMSATDAEGAVLGVALTKAKGTGWEIRRAGDADFSPLPKIPGGKALLLAADTEVRYNATAGEVGTAALSFKAWDSTGASNEPVRARTPMVSKEIEVLTVAVGNTAPGMDLSGSPTLPDVKVTAKSGRAAKVKSLLGSITDTPKAPVGIAVVAVDNTHGTWQYSLGGNRWVDFGNVSPGSAVLLTSSHRIRFLPNANAAGTTATIDFKAWDQSAGIAGDRIDTTGALNSFSAEVESASVSVIA